MTADQAMEALYWLHDRRAYRKACGIDSYNAADERALEEKAIQVLGGYPIGEFMSIASV